MVDGRLAHLEEGVAKGVINLALEAARRDDRELASVVRGADPDVELERLNGQLSNANFVEKAPAEKVQELRDRQEEIILQATTLANNVAALS